MKVGDSIVVVKGNQRGRQGKIIEVGGKCAGETAVQVILYGKRFSTVTFFPMSHVVQTTGGRA